MKLGKYLMIAGCVMMMGVSLAGCGTKEESVQIIRRADQDHKKDVEKENKKLDDEDKEAEVWDHETKEDVEDEDYDDRWDWGQETQFDKAEMSGENVNDYLFTIYHGKKELNLSTAHFEDLIEFFEDFDAELCYAASENYGRMIPAYSAPPLSGEYMIFEHTTNTAAEYIFYNPTDMDLPDYDCNIGHLVLKLDNYNKKLKFLDGKVNKNTTYEELKELLDKKDITYDVYQDSVITCKGESLYFFDDHEERIEVVFVIDDEGKCGAVYFDLDWSYWIRRGKEENLY